MFIRLFFWAAYVTSMYQQWTLIRPILADWSGRVS